MGIEGYKVIEEEIKLAFPNSLFYLDYPVNKSDELIFMRFTLAFENFHIKVEILQAFKLLHPIEIIDGIRMASVHDVAVF